MTRFKLTALRIFCLLGFLLVVNSCSKHARTVRIDDNAQKPAPAECLAAFRDFFAYIDKPEPNIVTDSQAQNRWLSNQLRKVFENHLKSFSGSDDHDYPSNQTFIGVWDTPTTYSVLGSRHYDYHNDQNPEDNRAVIDVLYEWDEAGSLDNQYPGEKSLHSFIFVHENGVWKLDDIYTYPDKYGGPLSLRAYFERQRTEH